VFLFSAAESLVPRIASTGSFIYKCLPLVFPGLSKSKLGRMSFGFELSLCPQHHRSENESKRLEVDRRRVNLRLRYRRGEQPSRAARLDNEK
jgi:hypothetical protein